MSRCNGDLPSFLVTDNINKVEDISANLLNINHLSYSADLVAFETRILKIKTPEITEIAKSLVHLQQIAHLCEKLCLQSEFFVTSLIQSAT